MQKSDFSYELPSELVAQQPLAERRASRLLHLPLDDGVLADRAFEDLPELLRADDLLVFNNTRVLPARLYARKASGGRVEILLERLLDEASMLVQMRSNRKPAPGSRLLVADGVELTLVERRDDMYLLRRDDGPVIEVLERFGHMPLPPYIQRTDTAVDRERYQTVYARRPGAVAAPTAGLHFDQSVLRRLDALGVRRTEITLHVGAGTFQPLRAERVQDNQLHAERIEVSAAACEAVESARAAGGRVIAVGTTSVRALESAGSAGRLQPCNDDSRLFIYPGYRFRVIDGMLTNFHLPESSLLMLVCAFAGTERVLAAYRHAVRERYRFFSYGDAMLLV